MQQKAAGKESHGSSGGIGKRATVASTTKQGRGEPLLGNSGGIGRRATAAST